jgi:hypothetical protein
MIIVGLLILLLGSFVASFHLEARKHRRNTLHKMSYKYCGIYAYCATCEKRDNKVRLKQIVYDTYHYHFYNKELDMDYAFVAKLLKETRQKSL